MNQYFMCDHGRLNYRWMNRRDRVEAPLVAAAAARSRRPTGTSRSPAAATRARGQARVRARVAQPVQRGAVPARRGSSTTTGGAGAFRVEQGDEAPLPGVEDLALRADRAANVRGAELLGFTRSDAPLAGDASAGDVLIVADDDLDGVDAPRPSRSARRGDRASARRCRRGRGAAPPWSCRSRTSTEEDGTFTNLRGRVQRFLQAQGGAGHGAAELVRARRPARRAGRAAGRTDRRARRSPRWRDAQPAFAGLSYDDLGLRGAMVRRRDGGSGARDRRMLALLQVADPQLRAGVRLSGSSPRVVKMLVVFTVYMVGVALLTLAERKISAWMQDRRGPNRVGPHGLLQPLADGLKNIMKEETLPAAREQPLFILAPMLVVHPGAADLGGDPVRARRWALAAGAAIDMVLSPTCRSASSSSSRSRSLGVYGIVLAGWSSNNKYALLGGLRASAQMVSYEIAMGMCADPGAAAGRQRHAVSSIVQQQALDSGTCCRSSLAFFIFIDRGASPRPTGCRSTCPRRSRS